MDRLSSSSLGGQSPDPKRETVNLQDYSSYSNFEDEIMDEEGTNHQKHTSHGKHIKLEILGKKGIYTLLIINYLCILMAVALDVTESRFRLQEITQYSNNSGGGALQHYNQTWSGFNAFNRFLLVALHVQTNFEQNITDSDSTFWEGQINTNSNLNPTQNNPSMAKTTLTLHSITSGRNSKNDKWKILEDQIVNTTCSTEQIQCSDLPALFFTSVVKYKEYNLDITVVNISHQRVLKDLSWDLELLLHNQNYSKAECVIFITFISITLIYLIYYVIQSAFLHPWKQSLPEQKWMFIVLLALFFYQNPLFLPEFLFNTIGGQVSGQIVEDLAYSIFLVIWLLIVDGISFKDHNYTFGFYFRKIIFGIVYFGLLSYTTIVPFYNVQVSAGEITRVASQVQITYLIVLLFVAVLSLFWFCWIIWRTYTTYIALKRIPFLSTRYRQLTFRFMFFLSLLSITYLTLSIFIKRASSGSNSNQATQSLLSKEIQYASLGRLLVLTIYCYTLVFCYLPPDADFGTKCTNEKYLDIDNNVHTCLYESQIQRDRYRFRGKKIFCLEIASLLYELAFQIYYDAKGYPQTLSSFGLLDDERLRRLGFILFNVISNLETDSHCMIFVSSSRKKIVTSFRGTASIINLGTDLNSITVTYDTAEKFSKSIDDNLLDQVLKCKIHKGFLTAFNSISTKVFESIQELISQDPEFHIFTTGHSLGGALATICAFELKVKFPKKKISCYTFGCPRVGNHRFAELFNHAIPNLFRIVNDRDIITSFPKRWLGFFVFKHGGEQILIDKRGNLIADLSYVEGLFRGGNSSLADHSMLSYQKSLSECYYQEKKKMEEEEEKSVIKSDSEFLSVPFALLFEVIENKKVQNNVEDNNLTIDENSLLIQKETDDY